mmetsp:Transcript_65742/g.212127  ORF Transcript_65742/g.212127 Transcript_65742/m.212127 type:complete len:201 (+) Transcript_65742:229-831(+)
MGTQRRRQRLAVRTPRSCHAATERRCAARRRTVGARRRFCAWRPHCWRTVLRSCQYKARRLWPNRQWKPRRHPRRCRQRMPAAAGLETRPPASERLPRQRRRRRAASGSRSSAGSASRAAASRARRCTSARCRRSSARPGCWRPCCRRTASPPPWPASGCCPPRPGAWAARCCARAPRTTSRGSPSSSTGSSSAPRPPSR